MDVNSWLKLLTWKHCLLMNNMHHKVNIIWHLKELDLAKWSHKDRVTKSHIGVNLLTNKKKYLSMCTCCWSLNKDVEQKRGIFGTMSIIHNFLAIKFLIVQAWLWTLQLLWVSSSNLNTRDYFAKPWFRNMFFPLILIKIRKIHVHRNQIV